MILAVVFIVLCWWMIFGALLFSVAQRRRLLAERSYWARQSRPVELYDWADDPSLWS